MSTSDLDWNTDYPALIFHGIPESLQENAGTLP
jgi:hypothetical protein